MTQRQYILHEKLALFLGFVNDAAAFDSFIDFFCCCKNCGGDSRPLGVKGCL